MRFPNYLNAYSTDIMFTIMKSKKIVKYVDVYGSYPKLIIFKKLYYLVILFDIIIFPVPIDKPANSLFY
jgi:hypothetical protein